MRHLLTLLVVLGTWQTASYGSTPQNAHEEKVRMEISRSEGIFGQIEKELAPIFKVKQVEDPTSQELKTQLKIEWNTSENATLVLTPVASPCGTRSYLGEVEFQPGDPSTAVLPAGKIQVLFQDHHNRRCKDLRPYNWEAHVRYFNTDKEEGFLQLQGKPSESLKK